MVVSAQLRENTGRQTRSKINSITVAISEDLMNVSFMMHGLIYSVNSNYEPLDSSLRV
jgi:hypothetical protein